MDLWKGKLIWMFTSILKKLNDAPDDNNNAYTSIVNNFCFFLNGNLKNVQIVYIHTV